MERFQASLEGRPIRSLSARSASADSWRCCCASRSRLSS